MSTADFPGMTFMRTLAAAFLASLLALPAWTQAAEDAPDRVARLSHIEGEVSMAPAGTQEWAEAVLNRPLTSEDRLFVDRDARAELQVGSATIHLDASTEFSFIDLDDDAMTMNLTEGRATIRILSKREREDIEVNTPNASVALTRPGEYHIEVGEDGETTVVKARTGEAEVAGEGDSYVVHANEVGAFRGTETLTADIGRLGPRTSFENWANDRARRNENSASAKYVAEGVIGYEDLDENGSWVHEPEYGYVWTPRYVVAGWAPYRYGRWTWVSPWGWTWIDDARWGFAPFHYGRWTYVSHRWCWVPGPRRVRAVYAPALVAWVGGPSVSVNIALGHGVGWFPLGPREVYVPGYWHTRRYIHRVNVSNTIIVNNTYIDNVYRGRQRDFSYRYRDRPDAVTVVDREHFVRGRPIGGRVVRVDRDQLRRWGNDARPPAIAPERESIVNGQLRTPRGFNGDGRERQVVTRRDPPRRVSFDDERRAIEANGGRPVGRTALIDRNPKEGAADFRIARGRSSDSERRSDIDRPGAVRSTPSVQRMRAVENDSREPRPQHEEARSQREAAIERNVGGSGPSLNPKDYRARERNSSDATIERAEQRQLEQRRDAARQAQRDSQRDWQSQRAAPRVERSYTPESRAQPRIERSAPEPRAQRSFSAPESRGQPRSEQRSFSQPQRSESRAERAPQPRAESRSHGSSGSSRGGDRASNHSRIDRGGGRER